MNRRLNNFYKTFTKIYSPMPTIFTGMIICLILAACTFLPTKTTESTTKAAEYYWWNDTVFYEIFVRSFYDGNGDGKGDFKGLTAKLDYLNDGKPETTSDLGITGIWLMPIHPSPSYHGYDVTDYMAINPDYGTMEEFKMFLSEAHARGIHVIIDFVANHTSDQNPWFVASQDAKSDKRDWYIWSDTNPGYTGPWDETVWYAGKSGYYYAIFWSGMPDLNYKNPKVSQQMEQVASFWLKDVGVDGFRVDGARYLVENGKEQSNTKETHNWYKQFRTFYKEINPQAMTIGEVWDSIYAAVAYAKGDEFDMVFDFDLASALVDGVNGRNAKKISNALSLNQQKFLPGQFGTFLTNHDMNRVMTQFLGDMGKMKSAATIYLTAPGVPFIYYGEEIGMNGSKPDEAIRTPMQWSGDANAGFSSGSPWEALNSDSQQVNVALQDGDPSSLLSWYRQLIRIRGQHLALQKGDTIKIETGSTSVFAMLRVWKDDIILVLVNLGDKPDNSYKLVMDKGLTAGKAYSLSNLSGEGLNIKGITANQAGGFSGYQPLPELPAGGNFILILK
jgi:alpha-amylase